MFNLNELKSLEPGAGKLWTGENQHFVIRYGIIDDPYAAPNENYITEKRHPLLGSKRDTDILGTDINPKDIPDNDKFTTKTKDNSEFEAFNRSTKKVLVRFIDDQGGLGRNPQRENYNNPSGQSVKGFGRQERAYVALSSPSFYVSRRNDDGQGNGPYMSYGIEHTPPVGTKVLVAFRRGNVPFILSCIEPGVNFSQKTSDKAKELGQTNSIIQNGFDVDINGPKSVDAFSPTIQPINLGELKLSSYGGSFIHLGSDPDNYTKRSRAQKADITVQHALGTFMQFSSNTIPDSKDFPGQDVQDTAENVNEANGSFTVQHQSGAYMEIADGGSIMLSDVQAQRRVDLFDWRRQDKSDNLLENENLVKIGEHRLQEDIRGSRINPDGRGNFIFMDGRDKIMIQDTAKDFITLQNDNITIRNKSETFLTLDSDKLIAKNAAGSQFIIDDKQISIKDASGNHILLQDDTIQIGNKDGTTLRIGKDGVTYSNATGSVISMNSDGIGMQTKTGAKLEKLEDLINMVAKTINITAEQLNITAQNTTMHSDQDTLIETGNNINFKIANNENHTVNNNVTVSSTKTSLKSTAEIQMRAKNYQGKLII